MYKVIVSCRYNSAIYKYWDVPTSGYPDELNFSFQDVCEAMALMTKPIEEDDDIEQLQILFGTDNATYWHKTGPEGKFDIREVHYMPKPSRISIRVGMPRDYYDIILQEAMTSLAQQQGAEIDFWSDGTVTMDMISFDKFCDGFKRVEAESLMDPEHLMMLEMHHDW